MLLELQISDFAIIEHLHLRLEAGLTVLTGETGAGKSIIIDALGTLRGEKVPASFVRAGSERARIEGIFSLADSTHLSPLLQEYGLWNEEDDHLILSREINAGSGRSTARINGRAVNASILRDIGGRLIDIHGQHEGVSIFNTRSHLDILDRYGGLLPLREQVGPLVTRLRRVRDEISELRRNEAQRHERIAELQMLLDDVEESHLCPEEEDELTQERSVLQNAVRIAELVSSTYATLAKSDESERYPHRPIVEAMAIVADELNELARLDPAAQGLAEQTTEAQYLLEDLATNLRAYRDACDFDPHRLEAIEDRLTTIRTMKRKYGGDIAQILQWAATAEEEIERLAQSGDHIADLSEQETTLLHDLGRQAGELSRQRRAAGDTLAQTIETAMHDLAMPHVQFSVSITQVENLAGVPVAPPPEPKERSTNQETPTYQISPNGIDRVEFLLSPNPGEPLKPLVHIASGGESSRLLLAIKSILSQVDTTPTLIFDEIEVGVGGRTGQVIGEKIWSMTQDHQVLCITHLPQVAAFADTHYIVRKEIAPAEDPDTLTTHTSIRLLTREQQIDELATMLDHTLTDYSRATAREMIERAHASKSNRI